MITNTQGFWQKDIFLDNENIIFVEDFDSKSWAKKINGIFYDDVRIRKISLNARETVLSNYKLEVLYEFLNKVTSEE